jgi:hypothetical protein
MVKQSDLVPQSLIQLFTDKLHAAIDQLITAGLDSSRIAAVVKPDLIFISLSENDLNLSFKYAQP